ncbi:ornithine-acyl[acyl carrier protein] N-acyltransferase [Rhodobacter aestuarii]|uniref:L-ornithine N(alpha)-acyltransferase n=1 Tax=Rhodobacter aestuarii TaxID=453582 RepID=A0A1N7J6X6_9RHOB|nr:MULTISPECIES: GNAT family N-acetyltransferase [Rhodobacter]PTV97114.1 ornithine-acyl[acyl carrier protein] N-acyltransferase [Rhodobacter aestuarii]SIS45113.1 ornithine-acyl[acyl carrier protein] N-acyltransferase [Rhodobacter aestuarii]SOB98559.1 ornithine-acyl[acyl carrier protein] N-acyltransferase [Rhodobacter sp. JA431]
MFSLSKFSLARGRYAARFAVTPEDVQAAQALRWRAFIANRGRDGAAQAALDVDAFDADCRHVLVEETGSGQLVCCFRLMPLENGAELERSYSAQFYDLTPLSEYPGKMVEMGRFCIDPACRDPDILRLAWGAVTRFVDAEGIEMLFGCSSFLSTDFDSYTDTFALLAERHLAPRRWRVQVKAPKVIRYARQLLGRKGDPKLAMLKMPPLLRSYLGMGGWVSDHAVVDEDLGTLHVFTGLEIGAIPPARARALRLVAG